MKSSPWESQSVETGRCDCLFKCADNGVRLQDQEELGKYDSTKGTKKPLKSYPKEMWIYEMPDKD